MDVLTQLIQIAQPQAELDLRCQMSGTYEIPHTVSSKGTAPFHLVLAGECLIETEQGILKAQAGDFVIFPRGAAHSIRSVTTSNLFHSVYRDDSGILPMNRIGDGVVEADLLCGHFKYEHEASKLLFQSLPDQLHISLLNDESNIPLQAIVDWTRQEANQGFPGALAIVTALCQSLLTIALRRFGENAHSPMNTLAVVVDPRLSVSVQALLKYPEKNWTIDTLGQISAMSRASYARHFKETTGLTVFEFITQVRMSMACHLLSKTDSQVSAVALEVGYQSEAAFGKAFKKHTGILPGQYRRTKSSFQ